LIIETCRNCGKVFNIISTPPQVENVCDVCGGELYQRDDDTEEAIKRRLEIFYTDTQEVIELFRNKGLLLEIDAETAPEVVFKSVLAALDLK
jgi:adenylate kinase